MSKRKRKKRIIILAVVLVIIILAVLGYIRVQNNLAELSKTTYEIVEVERGTIEVVVKGAGSIEPLYDNTVYATFSGTVDEVLAENGDAVGEGDVMVTFTSESLEAEQASLEQEIDDIDAAVLSMSRTSGSEYIYSSVEGTVKVVYAEIGDSVDVVMEKHGALAVICPDGLLETVIDDNGSLSLGDDVTVTVDTQSVQGEVSSLEDGQAVIRFKDDDFAVGTSAIVSTTDGAGLGEGTVEITNPVYVTAQGGEIDRIYEDAGDDVSRGGKLFRLDGDILSAELYAQIEMRKEAEEDLADVLSKIEALTVRADMDGIVSGLSLNYGQAVQEGAALFSIESSQEIKIDVEIDELDIADIAVGDEAYVTFDALAGQEYIATVDKINPIGVSVNNVTNYTITLGFDNIEGIMLGMSADVEIISETAADVLLIPIEAIQVIDGEKYVVFEEDIDEDLEYTTATHKIVTGITDGVNIEVLEGLSEGDRVAVPQEKTLTLQEQQYEMMSDFRDE